jgi:ketosteroid isomerase-like protein
MNHALPSDAEISKLLLGCWSGIELTHNMLFQYLTWYYPDQTLYSKGWTMQNGQKVEFITKGQWRIENGKLINHVTEDTIGSLVGQDLINAITAVDNQTSVFVSSENALVINEREDADHPDPDFFDRLVVRTYQVMVEFRQTDREQYGHWLAEDIVVTDMPHGHDGKVVTTGLDAVLGKINESNQRYQHDYLVQRVVRENDTLVFEWTDHRRTVREGQCEEHVLELPMCSLYEIADGKIARQTNYIAHGTPR